MQNKSHTILITGANRGIGLEFVKQYAKEGWNVLACCRNPNQASELQQVAKQYASVEIFKLDVTNINDIQEIVQTLKERPIDILINNAGIYGEEQSLGDISIEALQKTFLTNAVGPLKLSEALLPNLKIGQLKTIATISTQMASIDDNKSGGFYAYRASKAALNMIMKSLSIDLQSLGIKVLILHPGWVKTDMGGENAPIDAKTSVSHLREVIAFKHNEKSGNFYSYLGQPIEW